MAAEQPTQREKHSAVTQENITGGRRKETRGEAGKINLECDGKLSLSLWLSGWKSRGSRGRTAVFPGRGGFYTVQRITEQKSRSFV